GAQWGNIGRFVVSQPPYASCRRGLQALHFHCCNPVSDPYRGVGSSGDTMGRSTARGRNVETMAQTAKQNNQDTIIARLVLDHGLATNEEVTACQRKQRELMAAEKAASLAAVLIAQGVVTKRQLERLKPEVDDEKSA